MNYTSDALYPMDFEDTGSAYPCLERLEPSDLAWPDDIFSASHADSLPIPLQEMSFSIQSGPDPSTGRLAVLSKNNTFSQTDQVESERCEESWEESCTKSDTSRSKPCTASPAKIPSHTKHQKAGRRTGPLSPEKAKKVALIRRLKACWRCWLSKIQVSIGDHFFR
jgi:hypothetical protein